MKGLSEKWKKHIPDKNVTIWIAPPGILIKKKYRDNSL